MSQGFTKQQLHLISSNRALSYKITFLQKLSPWIFQPLAPPTGSSRKQQWGHFITLSYLTSLSSNALEIITNQFRTFSRQPQDRQTQQINRTHREHCLYKWIGLIIYRLLVSVAPRTSLLRFYLSTRKAAIPRTFSIYISRTPLYKKKQTILDHRKTHF